ncbi:peptidoglycan-binding protein [Streptomyces sp. NBC_00076]|uniref:peptidoglycan-binding domain-containing protein n=1 Tax=Streptomyces sp. NBC_00076 TaxID=2975642 RepID=UPI00386FF193
MSARHDRPTRVRGNRCDAVPACGHGRSIRPAATWPRGAARHQGTATSPANQRLSDTGTKRHGPPRTPDSDALLIALAGAPAVAASHGASAAATVSSTQAAHKLNHPGNLVAEGPGDICNYTKSRPSLQQGASGPAVQQAQCYLNQAIGAGLDEDGDFGQLTQTATKSFQRCAGIVVDGLIGAQTWSFLSFWANSSGAPFC